MALTKYEVFQRLWQYFVVEKHPQGKSESGGCFYAGPCAVGLFLPKEVREELDKTGPTAFDLPYEAAFLNPLQITDLPEPDIMGFWMHLQEAHDGCSRKTFHEEFRSRLTKLMKTYITPEQAQQIIGGDTNGSN